MRLFHICCFSCVIQPQSSLQDVLNCYVFYNNTYKIGEVAGVAIGSVRSAVVGADTGHLPLPGHMLP